ncbi:MAG: patatin-like phospholipase family protein [Propionivibrio sp.]|uniref:Patatin-like phospholipase family protein n=1 Tax=Candidatus Propionivibrio dominans TaxID=2954373 RepID=A0A9D7FEV9_9RHOO|nr:patatin-like phospholipase family protein [Candidatus Propionivibrio dominans]
MNERSVFQSLALAGLFVVASLAHAAETTRPRIGLVLGGGGARGAAHIGVLEVLEKLRIPVDCVAGTSMGGLVAGAFAAGLSPAEMRRELARADWNDMFIDSPPYSEVNYRNKAISKRFLPASETGVNSQGLTYQGGVVSGQKIKLFFNRLVNSDLGEREIETLPLPLSIIATDIGNGDKVVFRSGSLTKAMRASMSVPGLMAPVDYQGRKLVDGGLVDNVPIDVVRDHCQADIVIAVNVGSPLMKAEDVGSLLSVSVQMVNILTEQNVTRSLATLKPTDIYIKPDLEGISAGDFVKSSETADRGRKAALAVADRLQALAVSDEVYSAWVNRIAYVRNESPVIDEIQVAGLKVVNPAAVERQIQARSGERLDETTLNRDMLRIYGDGWFESVDYAVLSTRDRNILRVLPAEKSWGPDYLRFGINLESNFSLDSTYSLRVGYDKTWLNPLGGELIVAAEIGNAPGVLLDYYQPLEAQQRYFFDSSLAYGGRPFYLYQDNNRVAEYWRTRGLVSAGFGINVGLLGQIRTGWRQIWQEATLETGIPSAIFPAKTSESYGGEYVTLDFDQMDRLFFPSRGWSSKLAYFNSSQAGYSKVTANVEAAYPIGDFVINSRLSYQGSLNGPLPYYDAGSLGGFLNLSGFTRQELNGDNIRYGNIRVEKIIGQFPLGLRGDLRAGVALETGKVGTPYTQTQLSGWINSAAIYLGGETPLGPFYLGYGRSDSGSSNVYLFLGTP